MIWFTKYSTILADPPWRFEHRTGKASPEYSKNFKYQTMDLKDIKLLPVDYIASTQSHLYLWVPNALLPEGMEVLHAWGFKYKSYLLWVKTKNGGGIDGSGCGFYFRNATEIILFGIKGKNNRTLPPARSTTNVIEARKRGHSQKPHELYDLIEKCSNGPYIELFAREKRPNWAAWGNEI